MLRVEVWNTQKGAAGALAGIDMPGNPSDDEIEIAGRAVKETAAQILGKLGLQADLQVAYVDAMTPREMQAQLVEAHVREARCEKLPDTAAILAGIGTFHRRND